jgi:Skp family chaperone for outer membrane proteins
VLIALFIIVPGIAESFFWGSVKYGVIDLERIEREAKGFARFREERDRLQKEFEDFREQVLAEHARAIKELAKEFAEKTGDDGGTERPVLNREYTRRAEQLANEAQEKLDRKQKEIQKLIAEREKAAKDELQAIVEKIAEKKRVKTFLLKEHVIRGGKDLTDDIIKEWEKELKKQAKGEAKQEKEAAKQEQGKE